MGATSFTSSLRFLRWPSELNPIWQVGRPDPAAAAAPAQQIPLRPKNKTGRARSQNSLPAGGGPAETRVHLQPSARRWILKSWSRAGGDVDAHPGEKPTKIKCAAEQREVSLSVRQSVSASQQELFHIAANRQLRRRTRSVSQDLFQVRLVLLGGSGRGLTSQRVQCILGDFSPLCVSSQTSKSVFLHHWSPGLNRQWWTTPLTTSKLKHWNYSCTAIKYKSSSYNTGAVLWDKSISQRFIPQFRMELRSKPEFEILMFRKSEIHVGWWKVQRSNQDKVSLY